MCLDFVAMVEGKQSQLGVDTDTAYHLIVPKLWGKFAEKVKRQKWFLSMTSTQ